MIFALFRLGALPVFALPSHRSSEITYFCEFAEAKAYIIPDMHSGFDYRALARQVKDKLPDLAHVIVAGEAEEFQELSSLHREPVQLEDISPAEVAFYSFQEAVRGCPS